MRRARASLLIFSLTLTALVAILGGVSVLRKVETFQPLGFSAEPAGAGWQVQRVQDPATGLLAGDQVFQVEGREVVDLEGQLRGQATSELLVARGDQVVGITYHRPPLDVDYPFLILTLIGAAYLLIGLYTLFRESHRPGLLFFFWCLTSAVVYLFTPKFLSVRAAEPDTLDKVLYVVDGLARVWLPALTLHLFLTFPTHLSSASTRKRLISFVYLPAAVFTTLELDLTFNRGSLFFAEAMRTAVALLDRLELVHLVLFGIASVGVLGVRWWRRQDWEQRRQVQWIAFGLAGGYFPFAVFYLVPRLLGLGGSKLLDTVSVLPLALVPLAFAWAILRYKLWDIEVIVRDAISSTLTLMFGIIGFSLVHLAIDRGLPRDLELARNVLAIVSGLAVAGLMIPARQGIAAGLERFQYRANFLKRRALADLGQDLLRERDLGSLAQRLVDHLEESVPLSRVNLYLTTGGGLRPVRPEPGLPERLPAEGLGDEVWQAQIHPISATALPTTQIALQQRLFIAGYRYVFPLRVLDHKVGLVISGYKPEQTPINSDDIDLIRQLLDQAALAIENAQLLDQLHQRLDEVVHLQRYSEGILESTPAGIAVLDEADRVLSANVAFARLISPPTDPPKEVPWHPVATSLVGRSLAQILPLPPLPSPGGGPIEVSFCEPADQERHLQLSVSSFISTTGQPLRILVVHDISQRVAMENALRESDRLAALGMLAAGVAHEVNTPITGISSYAQMLLAETAQDDPRYEMLKKVEQQTFRAARIVNNLLEFARNKSSEQHPVDVVPLIGETLDLLKERLTRRSIRVSWQPPDEQVVVRANGGELQQVLTNLFINGSDAMSRRGGTLSIEVVQGETSVEIMVADTGVGIPAERLETIFQPFFSTKLNSGGTGLGLSISYEIVRRHGGDIRVESTPGKGSRFTVELPKVVEPS